MAKFANLLDQFELIDGQPSDTDFMRTREVVAPLLLQIQYDKTGAVHNLIGLIWPEAAYTTRCSAAFLEPTKVGAYYATIDENYTAVIRACTEDAHKANRAYHATYETARQETAQFNLAIDEDTLMREIRDTETIYTGLAPKALLAHLQAGCTGCHALDLLAMHNEMQHYHLKVDGIPEYINMLEDAQNKRGDASAKSLTKCSSSSQLRQC